MQYLVKAMMGVVFALMMMLTFSSVTASPIQTSFTQQSAQAQPQPSPSENGFQPIFTGSQQKKVSREYDAGLHPARSEYAAKGPTPNTGTFLTNNYQQLTQGGAEIVNMRPSRRTILSTLMAPIMSMREQAMNMLSASLQGCQSGNQSMWCRFWGMFLN